MAFALLVLETQRNGLCPTIDNPRGPPGVGRWICGGEGRPRTARLAPDLTDHEGKLMTLFFLVVGLEARGEFDLGDLRERRRLALPVRVAGVFDLVGGRIPGGSGSRRRRGCTGLACVADRRRSRSSPGRRRGCGCGVGVPDGRRLVRDG
ncbi:Na+/H+ antiporter NhaA [Micromonospora sp. STR1s_5]|nr:Na+/H+ antiporter NhaA [Micromonospora sp. STR1s_5]